MKKAGYPLPAVIVTAAVAGVGYRKLTGNPNTLRQVILQRRLPHQLQQQDPVPCAGVKPDAGYVVFKDHNGPLQYLLMSTWRISDTEDPLLSKSDTPSFFQLAWQVRSFTSQKYGQEIPGKAVPLTINPRSGYMQNRLHIHIPCPRTDVRKQLDDDLAKISTRWLPLPGGLRGHKYLARRITENELARRSPFTILAEEVSGVREYMGSYALAMVCQNDRSFVLLATQRNLLTLNPVSAEEIRDHQHDILR